MFHTSALTLDLASQGSTTTLLMRERQQSCEKGRVRILGRGGSYNNAPRVVSRVHRDGSMRGPIAVLAAGAPVGQCDFSPPLEE